MPNVEPYGAGMALVFEAAASDGRLHAAERGFAVLHHDRHFDPLCDALGVESVWIAEPGSID